MTFKSLTRLTTGLLAASLIWLLACSMKAEPPNVVLIIGDDISWNDFGCYGHPTIRTPNIDKLAADGIKFTNAFLTTSSCSPSRCSIITGRYPHNTGAAELHSPLPAEQIPFPLLLKEKGYYCAAGGKWHMGSETKRAFDDVRDDRSPDDPGLEKTWLPLLQNRPKDKPFFMWFASFDAHRGWDDQITLERHNPVEAQVPKALVDTEETRKDLAQYYDEIARLDFYVGEVEKELERQGVADNTIIIFMADNGRPFPRCKTRMNDSGLQTPFIIKWPKGIDKPGSASESLISAVDIAPTILDLCNIPIEENVQGKSFSALLDNQKQSFRNYVFAEHNWHDHEVLERMVRSDKYLYVLNERPQFMNCGPADVLRAQSQAELDSLHKIGQLLPEQKDVFLAPRPREELYSLENDPGQFNNLVDDPGYFEALSEMRELMARWRNETGDTTPENLTPDWFERSLGGKDLNIRTRGEMPGASKNATFINAKGPF